MIFKQSIVKNQFFLNNYFWLKKLENNNLIKKLQIPIKFLLLQKKLLT